MEIPDLEQHFVNPYIRVEPRCRTDDFSRGVQARTADPLWMLARQWQTGEFQGEDAGSPIRVRLRHSTQPIEDLRLGSGDAGPLGIRPLETAVEEEDRFIDIRERVRIGQEYERRLLARLTKDAEEDVARALVVGLRDTYAFPQRSGNGGPATLSDEDIARLDRATQRFVRFMRGRVVDGISVLHGLAAPAGYEIHQPALDSVAGEIPGWRNSVCSTPDNKQSPAWQASKLDYHFELKADAQIQRETADEQAHRTDFVHSISVRDALSTNEIVEGTALGGFVVREIVFHGAPTGNYTLRQEGPTAGKVRLLRNGVEVRQLSYNWQTTISFDNPYRFSFPGYFDIDIDIGRDGSGTQNLYGLNESFFDGNQWLRVQDGGALPANEIVEGTALGGFVVREIVFHGAPTGNYTLRQEGPTAGKVRLLRNGVEVRQLSYNWQTTISFDNPYRFSFPGYFDIGIGRDGSGTQNLYGLNESFFDGNQVLRVQDGGALPADEIVEGAEKSPFVIRGIVLCGAPGGDYTFRQDDPLVGEVRLLRNGVEVLRLSYNWQTTISFDNPYRFSFPGHFDIDIGNEGSGTRNLHGLNESFFDGNQVLRVQAQAPIHLVAPDYRNGEIDWYTFEAASAERGNWLPAASLETTPTRLALASTSPRWWAFEDGRTYFGGLDVNRPDLAKLLLMEMVLINADDWFSVPLPVEMGRLVRICELTGDSRDSILNSSRIDGNRRRRDIHLLFNPVATLPFPPPHGSSQSSAGRKRAWPASRITR